MNTNRVDKREHIEVKHPFHLSCVSDLKRLHRPMEFPELGVTNIASVSKRFNLRPTELAHLVGLRPQDCRSVYYKPRCDAFFVTSWDNQVRVYDPTLPEVLVLNDVYDAYTFVRNAAQK